MHRFSFLDYFHDIMYLLMSSKNTTTESLSFACSLNQKNIGNGRSNYRIQYRQYYLNNNSSNSNMHIISLFDLFDDILYLLLCSKTR